MALSVHVHGRVIDWYTGGSFSTSVAEHISTIANDVIMVSADGDELIFVKMNFENVPYHRERIVTWYGDFAKFIAGNLYSIQIWRQ